MCKHAQEFTIRRKVSNVARVAIIENAHHSALKLDAILWLTHYRQNQNSAQNLFIPFYQGMPWVAGATEQIIWQTFAKLLIANGRSNVITSVEVMPAVDTEI